MTNKYAPHLLVLPEDDANRQIANGFVKYYAVRDRRMQVLPPEGGWIKTKNAFLKEYSEYVRTYRDCIFMLLIDMDGRTERPGEVNSEIPQDLQDRVFILGTESEPEELRSALNSHSLEGIGLSLAEECVESRHMLWNHPMLQHNQAELNRIRPMVKPFLFQND